MSFSILNNISSLAASNNLALTQASLQKTLLQLSSGSRINSGADDAAGLAIADGLHANSTALMQSARNATDGVGMLQVADGALAQVTALLNRAVTLATEASTGTVGTNTDAIDAEYKAILTEIDNIGTTTTYNGTAVFDNSGSVFLSDGTVAGNSTIDYTTDALDSGTLGLGGDLTDVTSAQTELTAITDAITAVATQRGTIGGQINQLQAASNVMSNEMQNVTAAEDSIRAADIPSAVANLSKYNILQQTGMAALQQANQMQQSVLKLLQ
jgi:flagellin